MWTMQNRKNGEIKNVKVRFDWSTLILSFLLLGWLPSLFRKDINGTITILMAQIIPCIFLAMYIIKKSQYIEILLLISISIAVDHIIFKCMVNLKRYIEILKKSGFELI
ncbi:MAG: hypothetical protein ACRDDY_09330 [Clostridium sp.]|uniref:hypothetical protein n=1 Tax=Clostridium sp. TaxID=1506 RepID=UPI003EE696CC